MRPFPRHRAPVRSAVALAALGLTAAACSADPDGGSAGTAPSPTPATSSAATGSPTPTATTTPESPSPTGPGADAEPIVAGTVTEGLETPWGLTFLPDGTALVGERDTGRVLLVGADGRTAEAGVVPGLDARGEGGLLGLAVSPTFAADRLVYAYYTGEDDNRVVRMPLRDGQLGEPELVLDGIDKAAIHNGGRIAFGPDGLLHVGTGDAGEGDAAQDPDDLNGKILRVTPDGEPAPGNPTEDSPVLSLGHRNVQGLAWDAEGRLWASEFGQSTYDELNLIEPGGNYGWPLVEGVGDDGRFVDPETVWSPAEASPSGIAIAGDAVYVATLRGARLWQVPISGGTAGEPRDHLTGEYGRLRTVVTAPDGSLWLTTSNTDGRGEVREGDDRILRLELS